MAANAHPADVLGGNEPSNDEIDFKTIAKQIEGMKPRALTTDQFDDVVTLIEYMQGEVIKAHTANLEALEKLQERERKIKARERALDKRQREIDTHARALHAAVNCKDSLASRVGRYLRG